jgi:hypothetical protein
MVLLALVGVATLAACQVPASGIIAIIVGGLAIAGGGTLLFSRGCAHRGGPFGACLSPVPVKQRDAGVKRDSAAKVPKAPVHPCLEAVPPKKTPMRVCLSVDPIEGTPRRKPMQPCLSIPAPKPSSKRGAAAEPPTTALDDRAALLARHVAALPEDVARRLAQPASMLECGHRLHAGAMASKETDS